LRFPLIFLYLFPPLDAHYKCTETKCSLQVRDSDADTFGVLFERRRRRLFDFLSRTTGNRTAAEGLALDVFCQVLKFKLTSGKAEALIPQEAAGLRALEEALESAKRLAEIFEEDSGSVRRWITNAARKGLQSS
jgi:hypothetical protein